MSGPLRPVLLVGIDTEADDQWTDAGRRRMEVKNALRLPALQALFEEHGARPTYLVTHEMATGAESAPILAELARSGKCEIGAHLHPWSSPPFRPEDLAGHTYPHNLPSDLLERQIRELTETIEARLGVRPRSYKAGRNGVDGRSLRILEGLGYAVDTSVDPLFNERRKKGTSFAGAPSHPYYPDYDDVRRPGASKVLEVPISAATVPAMPKALERLYVTLPAIPYRGALKRLGIRAVWLRPSYASLPDMLAFASRLVATSAPCLNVTFHSSEILPGGSPYTPDAVSVARFVSDLRRLLDHAASRLDALGMTYGEFAGAWAAAK